MFLSVPVNIPKTAAHSDVSGVHVGELTYLRHAAHSDVSGSMW